MSARLRSKETRNTHENILTQFVYIEINLEKDDSLQSLSMKFGVSITDLKRVNSLLNERDIFALKTIKIPIKPNSFLANQYKDQLKFSEVYVTRLNTNGRLDSSVEREEILRSEEEDNESIKSDSTPNESIVGQTNAGHLIIETEFTSENENSDTKTLLSEFERNPSQSFLPKTSNKQVKDAKKFFKKLDNNLETLKHQNKEIINNVNRVNNDMEHLIPVPDITYSVESKPKSIFSTNSYLNSRDILIIACFVVVLIPLILFIYSLYYYDEHH